MKVEVLITEQQSVNNQELVTNGYTEYRKMYPTEQYFYLSGDLSGVFPKHRVHVYNFENNNKDWIAPMFTFANNELCLICNDPKINNDLDGLIKRVINNDPSVSYDEYNLAAQVLSYLRTLNGEKYQIHTKNTQNVFPDLLEESYTYDAFNQVLTLPEGDYMIDYNIKWKMSDNFSYLKPETVYTNDINELIVNVPENMLRSEAIHAILSKEMLCKVSSEVEACIKELALGSMIETFYIGDPSATGWYDIETQYEKTISPNTTGCCYKTKKQATGARPSCFLNGNKCILVFSPMLYYMSPSKRRRLIMHELTHALIGVEHGHDEFFWDTYEKITGYSRNFDNEYYSESATSKETTEWNSNHAPSESIDVCKIKLKEHFARLAPFGIKQL